MKGNKQELSCWTLKAGEEHTLRFEVEADSYVDMIYVLSLAIQQMCEFEKNDAEK